MLKISQKNAVVQEVVNQLPNFKLGQDVALSVLTLSQIEFIKNKVTLDIFNGVIEYSKDLSKTSEVKSYARSMVMNHLKKAKELNGSIKTTSSATIFNKDSTNLLKTKTKKLAPKGVKVEVLPDFMEEFAQSLV